MTPYLSPNPEFVRLREWVRANAPQRLAQLPNPVPGERWFNLDGVLYGPLRDEEFPEDLRPLLGKSESPGE